MDPQPLLPMSYFGDREGPWPDILKVLGLFAIVFGAADACTGAINGRFSISGPSPGMNQIYLVAKLLQIVAGVLFVVVGIQLLQRSIMFPLIVSAACGAIAVRAMEIASFLSRYPGAPLGSAMASALAIRICV